MNRSFKRLSNHVSPYTHDVVTHVVSAQDTKLIHSNDAFLIAKQILADLPLVPTGERVYELTQQIQMGLLNDVCPLNEVYNHWQECLDVVESYLKGIKVWEQF